MFFHDLTTDAELQSAFPLMSLLRDRLRRETFADEVRLQQAQGYRLIGGYTGGHDAPLPFHAPTTLAGIRPAHTLSRGPHLFVDDLITAESVRGLGHGRATLRYLAAEARRLGLPRLYLDSRATARGFYEKAGFTFLTAIPCWVDVADADHEETPATGTPRV